MALSFLAALAAFLLLRGAEPSLPGGAVAPAVTRPATDTGAEIARLQAAVRAAPRDAAPRVELAGAYLQRARETGDYGFYARADGLLREALSLRPGDPGALVVSASLALSRHDFSRGLALARRARAAQPEALAAYPALVDALVELGRFGAAERTLQQMIDAKPTLAGYARVSYLRELHGDLDGAVAAMRRAIAAGGPVRGERRRRAVAARRARARARAPGGGAHRLPDRARRGARATRRRRPASRRLAAASGDLDGAVRRWRALAERLPLPEYVIGHGEALLAAGERGAARRELALVGAEQRLSGGVNVDAELAVFEADHGNREQAVALARRAWRGARRASARPTRVAGRSRAPGGRRDGLRWAHRALRARQPRPDPPLPRGHRRARRGPPAEGRAHLGVALRGGLGGWPWQAAARPRRAGRGAR